MECLNCGDTIPPTFRKNSHPPIRTRGKSKYCSAKCSGVYQKHRYKKANPVSYSHLHPSAIGTLQELRVCGDLIAKGFEVFRAVCGGCSCDLAILKDRKVLRIEVTTVIKSPAGKLSYLLHDPQKYDILALVFRSGEVIYKPTMPEWPNIGF